MIQGTGSAIQRAAEPQVAAAPMSIPRPPSLLKRLFDRVFAVVALLALLPLLLILTAAIWLESRGNPMFLQERVGLNGKRFMLFKLRSMCTDAEQRRSEIEHLNEADPPLFKVRRDPRITRVGRFLRATSLDELPQLFNVVRGEMSLVGPRPPLPHEVETYTPEQARRLTAMPGLTGWWQVHGRSACSFEEYVAMDLHYIDHRSIWLDLKLIIQTVWVVVRGRGAW